MNAQFIACLMAIAVGVQAYPGQLPATLPANSEFTSTLGLYTWIDTIVEHLQYAVSSAFEEWAAAIQTVATDASQALDDIQTPPFVTFEHQPRANASTCIREHVNRLAQIAQAGGDDLAKCIQTAVNRTIALRDRLQANLDAIRAEGAKIGQVVKQCRESEDGEVRQCIIDNLRKIVDSVKVILSETLDLMITSVAVSQQIVEDTKACVNGVVERVQQQQIDSQTKLRECLANLD